MRLPGGPRLYHPDLLQRSLTLDEYRYSEKAENRDFRWYANFVRRLHHRKPNKQVLEPKVIRGVDGLEQLVEQDVSHRAIAAVDFCGDSSSGAK